MNWNRLERPTLHVPRVAWQRWVLVAVAVIAAGAATALTALAAGQQAVFVFVLVLGLAILAVIRPDSHAATTAEAVVVVQWLASADDTTSAWAMLVALCLFVFHVVIAAMALTPVSATVDRSIVVRWARRSAWIVLATLGTWVVVFVMAERRARGSATLTVVGFVTLAVLVVMTLTYRAPSAHDRGSTD